MYVCENKLRGAEGSDGRGGRGRGEAPAGVACKQVDRAGKGLRVRQWTEQRQELAREPLRTNITPDHRLGSPGVRLTKTPLGQACLRPALRRGGASTRD